MMRVVILAALLLGAAGPSAADAAWFEAGDTVMRTDVLLLNDAGIIRLPAS